MWNKAVGLLHRFNKTFRKYWRVVVPVHLLSSAMWFGGCYYASESGYDVLKALQKHNVREDLLDFFVNSSFGHLTVTIALYKLLTPFRYVTTFVASIYLIRYFSKMGYLKSINNNKKCPENKKKTPK